MASASPVTKSEFTNLMEGLPVDPAAGIAVAVSGGADSMALARLVADWRAAIYLTVDHGLRPDSADEAKQVHRWFAALGLDHHILTITDPAPETGIQEWARQRRYAVLEDWCVQHGIGALLIAHHLEDQAETFLLRLVRGSGIDGLAGMASVSPSRMRPGGPRLVRPLLQVPKARLEATLRSLGQKWFEDPSNRDQSYTRVRIRELMANFADEGLSADRLARTARRMRRARDAFDRLTDQAIARYFEEFPEGYGYLSFNALIHEPRELALRVVCRLVMACSGSVYPPREEQLERLIDDMAGEGFSGATLSGAMIQRVDDGRLLFCREPAAASDSKIVGPGETVVWDGRFLFENVGGKTAEISALGEAGWRVAAGESSPEAGLTNIPAVVGAGLPAFRTGEEIIAVPAASFGETGQFRARFMGFGRRD